MKTALNRLLFAWRAAAAGIEGVLTRLIERRLAPAGSN